MKVIELETPLTGKDVRSLNVGDSVTFSGTLFSMRDQATLRILEILKQGNRSPVDLSEGVVFHAGPAVDRSGDFPRIVSIGPTTSARMNSTMPELIELLEIRCVIGKGGMDEKVLEEMTRKGCVYLSAIGGCAALYTKTVEKIIRIVWEEMGPEAIYKLEVKHMAPLFVTMDSRGGSLHRDIESGVNGRLAQILGRTH